MDVFCGGSSVQIHTPAKLNLFLEVSAKRADGYHEIETLMIAVSVYDTLYVSRCTESTIRLTWKWATGMEAGEVSRARTGRLSAVGAIPDSSDNIICRAAEQLRLRAGIESGASIRLVKRIPTESGLGGASSDAAATLVGANHAWQLGWTRSRLAEVASELGSDVPFFLHAVTRGADAAVCRGRGELVEPIAGVPKLHFVLVRPPAGLATAKVYARCRPASQPARVTLLVEALRRGDRQAVGRLLVNRLQAAAEELSPWVHDMRRRFDQLDCLGHQMSGSGTSYFGICRSARQARRLLANVRAMGLGPAFCAETATTSHCLEKISAQGERLWRSPRSASN